MSAPLGNKNALNKHWKLSEETKKKISKAKKGKRYWLGKKHCEESKRKMREARKKWWKLHPLSEEEKKKRGEFLKSIPKLRGENHPLWRGGRIKNRGYILFISQLILKLLKEDM